VGVLQEEEKTTMVYQLKGSSGKWPLKQGVVIEVVLDFFRLLLEYFVKNVVKKIKGKISMKLCVFIT